MKKTCTKCKQEKAISYFYKTKYGYKSICIECHKQTMRDYRLECRTIENYKILAQEYEDLKAKYKMLNKKYNNLLKM